MDMLVPGGTRQATDTERANFIVMAQDTTTALSTGISRLRAQEDLFAGAEESRTLRIRVGELDVQLAMVNAEVQAALAGQRPIAVPTTDEVNRMKALVRRLDGLVAGYGKVEGILTAVSDVVGVWNSRGPTRR